MATGKENNVLAAGDNNSVIRGVRFWYHGVSDRRISNIWAIHQSPGIQAPRNSLDSLRDPACFSYLSDMFSK